MAQGIAKHLVLAWNLRRGGDGEAMMRWQRPLGWLSLLFGTLTAVSVVLGLGSAAAGSEPVVAFGMLLRGGLAVVLLLQAWRFLRPVSTGDQR